MIKKINFNWHREPTGPIEVYRNLNPGTDASTFLKFPAGECDLPVLHLGGRVSEDSFSASGFLGKNYEPYQARIDNDLPWCDRGSRDNVYIQVDLGGSLKVLGVATKGHKEHWQSWVSSYKVSYSMNGKQWNYANVGGNMVRINVFSDGWHVSLFDFISSDCLYWCFG